MRWGTSGSLSVLTNDARGDIKEIRTFLLEKTYNGYLCIIKDRRFIKIFCPFHKKQFKNSCEM